MLFSLKFQNQFMFACNQLISKDPRPKNVILIILYLTFLEYCTLIPVYMYYIYNICKTNLYFIPYPFTSITEHIMCRQHGPSYLFDLGTLVQPYTIQKCIYYSVVSRKGVVFRKGVGSTDKT